MANKYSLNPYVCFEGRSEEAIKFYSEAIGAVPLMVMHFKDAPPEAKAQMCGPAVTENMVMHASLRIGSAVLMLSDGRCTGQLKFDGFSLSLTASNPAEAEQAFKALSAGGKVEMPLAKTFFSPAFGVVADKFGVKWMVYVEGSH
jgi:PhnB protein